MIARIGAVVRHSVGGLQSRLFEQPVNAMTQPGSIADKPAFLVTQRNALARFRLKNGEAIVATFDPGEAAYAAFPVTNIRGVAPAPRARQNSLDARQAVPNPDGACTVMLTSRDLAIADWIDPAGLLKG
ncbi:MAG: hypothetical protein ABW173_07355 [Sphingomonas sp.]